MQSGKLRPIGKVLDHWQLLHESDFEDTDTKLLLHCYNDTDFAAGKTVTNNNVTYSTSVWKFAPGSGVFNGTNSYLTVPTSSDWAFGTGNFTIDCRIRFNTLTAQAVIIDTGDDVSAGILVRVGSGNSLQVYINGASATISDTISYTTGVWYHFAIIRNGTDVKVFIDGVQTATTGTNSANITNSTDIFIGARRQGPGQGSVDGWIDEFRIVKGTAKWTSNFTPPTYAYRGRTSNYYITDPQNVLMISGQGANGSTAVIDECGNPMTCNGNAAITTAQYKFGASSIVFDGAGDYLSTGDSVDWYFGDQPFTADMWVRFNALGNCSLLYQQTDGSNGWDMYYNNGAHTLSLWSQAGGSNTVYITCPWTPSTGIWYHIAWIRESSANAASAWGFYINGVRQTLTLGGGSWNGVMGNFSGNLQVGSGLDGDFNGWLQDIRISKGIARWTSSFTPPLKTTALINGDTDEEYNIIAISVNSYAGNNGTRMTINGDSGTNYGDQYLAYTTALFAIQATTNSYWTLNPSWATGQVGDVSICEGTLYAKSGYVRTWIRSNSGAIIGTTTQGMQVTGSVWNNTTAPIASFNAFSDNTNGLGLGSKILLYRRVN